MIKHLHIRYKQLAIIALPFIGLLGFATFRLDANLDDSRAAERANRATLLTEQISQLVHGLQTERDLTAGYIGSGRRRGEAVVRKQRASVDEAVRAYRAGAAALDRDSYGQRFGRALQEAEEQLKDLGRERQKLDEDEAPALPFLIMESYGSKINSLIEVIGAVPGQRGAGTLDRNLLMVIELAQLKQAVSEQRGLIYGVLSAGSFSSNDEQDLLAKLIASEEVVHGRFRASAMVQQRDLVEDVFGQRLAKDVDRWRRPLLKTEVGARMQAEASGWWAPATQLVDSLRSAEKQILAEVLSVSTESKARALRDLTFCTVAIIVTLIVSVGGAMLMSSSMTRSLRRLREGAEDVAERQLPGVVDRLAHLRSAGPLELEEVTDASPVKVDSRDEIGQVAEAFNAVHRVAVRVAMEQAALRKSVGDMFLNLARRNQDLIDRQLELIDELERDEEDPDRLEELFRVDHLATRMRRNAEDLIILSGNRPARRWDGSVPLSDVVRAALAEVENYTRVEISPVTRLNVVGESVGDIVHLVAELMENAVQFSPPGENVQVTAHPIAGGHVIEITDRGCGMSDEDLADANCKLADPRAIDLALSERLGLHVVSQLASRHDVSVTLRPSWYGGITASVVLPNEVLEVPESLTDPSLARHHAAAGVTTDEPLAIFEQARSEWFERRAEVRSPTGQPRSQTRQLPANGRPQQPLPPRDPAAQPEPAALPASPSYGGPSVRAGGEMPRFAEDISPEVVGDDADLVTADGRGASRARIDVAPAPPGQPDARREATRPHRSPAEPGVPGRPPSGERRNGMAAWPAGGPTSHPQPAPGHPAGASWSPPRQSTRSPGPRVAPGRQSTRPPNPQTAFARQEDGLQDGLQDGLTDGSTDRVEAAAGDDARRGPADAERIEPDAWTPTRPPGVRLSSGRPAPQPRNGRFVAPPSPTRPPGVPPGTGPTPGRQHAAVNGPAANGPAANGPAANGEHGPDGFRQEPPWQDGTREPREAVGMPAEHDWNGRPHPDVRRVGPASQQRQAARPARPPSAPTGAPSARAPQPVPDALAPPVSGGLWTSPNAEPDRATDLPQRQPSRSIAPGLAAALVHPVPPPMTGTPRAPEEIRRMLSSYRSGLERGRQESTTGPLSRAEARSGDREPDVPGRWRAKPAP